MNRTRLTTLVLFALLATSGTGTGVARDAEGAHAEPPAAEGLDVHARLRDLNPHLTEAQLDRIEAAIVRSSSKYGLDPELVLAVIEVESHGRPEVRSPKGALGLMQVMPYMIRPMGLAGNPSTIEANIEAGCMILAGNIARLGEDDGISAYFWGSDIRGVSYLNRVRAARDRLRADTPS